MKMTPEERRYYELTGRGPLRYFGHFMLAYLAALAAIIAVTLWWLS